MTTKEAIEDLKLSLRMWGRKPQKESYEMAIQALEKEPCGDAISRQAVIKHLHDEYHGMISDESMKIYKIIELLNKLPSVQPESRWIPSTRKDINGKI